MCLPRCQTEGQERGVVILFVFFKGWPRLQALHFTHCRLFFPQKIIIYIKADKYTLKFYLDEN